MPIELFEIACAIIIAATLAITARRTPWRTLLADYATLAVAGWIGEQTCIALYRFYAYDSRWDLFVGDVPLLVPLIWPLVVLSARDVATGLAPHAGPWARAALVALVVVVDASLVEVVAVRAGLWAWAENGHLGVPIIGMLGWGYFAFGAERALSAPRHGRKLAILAGPLAAHALIQASWWGSFRWTLRGELGSASLIGMVSISAILAALVVAQKRNGNGIPMEVAAPRLLAAGLFFALLLSVAPREGALWLHVLAVAVPYVLATRWPQGSRTTLPSSTR